MKFIQSLLLVLILSNYSFAIDLSLPKYQPKKLEQFRLSSIGSDSMGDLMKDWITAYRVFQPKAEVSLVSRGSASAPPALVAGISDLGPMARPMKTEEREDFMSRFGFEPVELKTAIAAVVVYVSKDNPLNEISLQELDAIYSAETIRAGKRLSKWQDLGIEGELAKKSIRALALDDSLPLSEYFQQKVILQADFSDNVKEASFSQALSVLKSDPTAIAFGGYLNEIPEGVKALAVSEDEKSEAVSPLVANLEDSTYPLARFLNLYFVSFPEEGIEPQLNDFFSFILSREGQAVVAEQGLVPLTKRVVEEERGKL